MIIVVGIDGSPQARGALLWAAREARLHDAELWVVNAWGFPFVAPDLIARPVLEAEVLDEMSAAAAELLEHELQRVEDAVAGLDVGRFVVQGAPADVLVEVAEGAGMLFLGSRRHRAVEPPDPDSVVQQCVHRAHCPVVVVPAGD